MAIIPQQSNSIGESSKKGNVIAKRSSTIQAERSRALDARLKLWDNSGA
jgi:hypothetical protein